MITPLTSPVSNNNSRTLYGIIQNLNLTTSLDFVLDAADTRCYDGSSQTWTDPVAANNFFLGLDVTASATDPTFVGTAGLATDGTYFSFDGGDYFTETAAHTFADEWHQNNGAFSIVSVFYSAAASARNIFGNTAGNATDGGIDLSMLATDVIRLRKAITDTTDENLDSVATVTSASWNFVGVSFVEATPTATIRVNGTSLDLVPSASTSTEVPSNNTQICARGNNTRPFANTDRLACIAGWSAGIGSASVGNIYAALKARRFITLP